MIELHNINFLYGENQILFDINLKINKGETTVLLGRSGAGKSTLIRIFNLLAIPSTGTYRVGEQCFDFSKNIDSKVIQKTRQHVGMVFQQYHLWPHLTVLENLIKAPMQVLGISKEDAITRAESLLQRLKIVEFAKSYPLMLSGGQQQRAAIARALMMQPSVLLFDEPTAALDPEITEQITGIINELSYTGITQIIVTHEVNFAKKIASKVVYLEQGRIVEQGDNSIFTYPKTTAFSDFISY